MLKMTQGEIIELYQRGGFIGSSGNRWWCYSESHTSEIEIASRTPHDMYAAGLLYRVWGDGFGASTYSVTPILGPHPGCHAPFCADTGPIDDIGCQGCGWAKLAPTQECSEGAGFQLRIVKERTSNPQRG